MRCLHDQSLYGKLLFTLVAVLELASYTKEIRHSPSSDRLSR